MQFEDFGQPARAFAPRRNLPRPDRNQLWRRCLAALASLLVAAGCLVPTRSASAVDAVAQNGSNSRQSRDDAARSIPFDKLPPDILPSVRQVVQNPSLFRRVPVQVIECDPNLYLFLVRHPEVIVNIWQVMGISKVQLNPVGPATFEGDDAAGTTGMVRLCYSNHDTQVIYSEGRYEGPMFSQPIAAQCVLVLRAGYVQETNGRYYITNRLDAFIHIDHVGLDLVAKTFAPLAAKTIDINFRETAAFVGVVSRTCAGNPQGMRRLTNKLTGVQPEVRGEFMQLISEVASNAAANALDPALAGPKPNSRPMRR